MPKSWPAFYRALSGKMMSLPGVQSAAYASSLPIAGLASVNIQIPGQPINNVDTNEVSPGYFSTLGIPIVQGRALEDSDSARGVRCAVVSQALARQFFGGEAVGKTLLAAGQTVEIVGVARDTSARYYGQPDGPAIYPLWSPDARRYQLLVRFSGDAGAMSLAAQAALRELAPDAFIDVRTVRSWMEERLARFWTMAELVVLLGAIAAVLAVVGIYGVVSFSVSRRTKEVGIRLALGARQGDIFHAVVSPAFRPISKGILAGLVLTLMASMALDRLFRGLPLGLNARDPRMYAAVSLLLVLAALAAMVGPARRAAACDPVEALREE
jgi:ABC-type antimicrobial peptide transport system permease subunit